MHIGGVGLHSEGGAPPPFGIKVISLIHPYIFQSLYFYRPIIRKKAFKQHKIKEKEAYCGDFWTEFGEKNGQKIEKRSERDLTTAM